MEIIEYNTTSWEELEKYNHDSKSLARFMGIIDTYDTALPQQWLDKFVKKSGLDYSKVLYSSFMVYTKNNYWGTPYSAWDECQQAMNRMKIDWIKAVLSDHYSEKIKEDLNRLCGIKMKEASGILSRAIIKSLPYFYSWWWTSSFVLLG